MLPALNVLRDREKTPKSVVAQEQHSRHTCEFHRVNADTQTKTIPYAACFHHLLLPAWVITATNIRGSDYPLEETCQIEK